MPFFFLFFLSLSISFFPPLPPPYKVGSHWDGKESIFRNHGGILGPGDEPVVILRLSSGSKEIVNILWYDPVDASNSYTIALEVDSLVKYHKPNLDRPIRPGIWTVKVETDGYSNRLLMEVNFLVLPLTHKNMRLLENPQEINAIRAGHLGKKMLSKYSAWKANVTKVGTDLEEWVDSLVTRYWMLDGYCRSHAKEGVKGAGGSSCGWLSDCVSTAWSTRSPDTKSELPTSSKMTGGRFG